MGDDRSVLEFDHSKMPSADPVDLLSWAMALRAYLVYEDTKYLPAGVRSCSADDSERMRAALTSILSMPILSEKTPMQQRGEMKNIAKLALEPQQTGSK